MIAIGLEVASISSFFFFTPWSSTRWKYHPLSLIKNEEGLSNKPLFHPCLGFAPFIKQVFFFSSAPVKTFLTGHAKRVVWWEREIWNGMIGSIVLVEVDLNDKEVWTGCLWKSAKWMMSRYPEPLHGCARVGNIQGLKHQHYIRIQNYSSSTLNWSGEIQLQVLNTQSM